LEPGVTASVPETVAPRPPVANPTYDPPRAPVSATSTLWTPGGTVNTDSPAAV
jgi:hypothetical protein